MAKDNGKALGSLNHEYLCYNSSTEAGKVISKFDRTEFNQQLEIAKANTIANAGSESLTGLNNLMRHPKFAAFHLLQKIGRYQSGDFSPLTKDKDFQHEINKVGLPLITKMYFGEVWIGYSENLLNIEKGILEKEKKDGGKQENYPTSKIRLYIRQGDERESKYKFRSVGTNVEIDLDPNNLVLASFDGMDNGIGGGNIISNYLGNWETVYKVMRASIKTVVVDVQDINKWEYERNQGINSTDPFLIRNNQGIAGASAINENEFEEFELFPLEGVMTVIKNNRAVFDEWAAWYNFIGKNLDQKKDRVTVKESGIDFKQHNNIQQSYLRCLRVVVEEMKRKFPEIPEDFRVKLNSNEPHQEKGEGHSPFFNKNQFGENDHEHFNNKFNNEH